MSWEMDETRPYMMPVGMWQLPYGVIGSRFDENIRFSVKFVTDADAMAKLLPPGFTPDEVPVISVNYAMCRGINYMVGGGYNLVDVDAAVRFDGTKDHVRGNYGLVIWMNEWLPLVLGREVLGAAKLFADVPDVAYHPGGGRSFYASERGACLLEGSVWDLEELSRAEIEASQKASEGTSWLGYKYIPALNELPEPEPDVAYATWLPTTTTIKRAWKAKGKIEFHDVPWEKAPVGGLVASILSKLPVVEWLDAWVQEDSCVYERNRRLE